MDTLSRMDGSLESTFERLAAAVYPELDVGPVFLDPTQPDPQLNNDVNKELGHKN